MLNKSRKDKIEKINTWVFNTDENLTGADYNKIADKLNEIIDKLNEK